MYDFPRAGSPTMTITSFAATSRSAIRPSGETLDLVMPGILRVVAGGRVRGVVVPEFCLMGGLVNLVSNQCIKRLGGLCECAHFCSICIPRHTQCQLHLCCKEGGKMGEEQAQCTEERDCHTFWDSREPSRLAYRRECSLSHCANHQGRSLRQFAGHDRERLLGDGRETQVGIFDVASTSLQYPVDTYRGRSPCLGQPLAALHELWQKKHISARFFFGDSSTIQIKRSSEASVRPLSQSWGRETLPMRSCWGAVVGSS